MPPDVFNAWCVQVGSWLCQYLDYDVELTFSDPTELLPEWNGPRLFVVVEDEFTGLGMAVEPEERWMPSYAADLRRTLHKAQVPESGTIPVQI